MKTSQRRTLTYYIIGIAVFLTVLLISIVSFFYSVQKSTDTNTMEMLSKNVQQQKDHFQIFLEEQYSHLEALATYIGEDSTLFSQGNLSLIEDLEAETSFHRVTIFQPDGDGITCDGSRVNSVSRDYFRKSLRGQRGLSDPLKSFVDGKDLIALSVPIKNPEGKIAGVLAASYDISQLKDLLFKDFYDQEGYSLIVSGTGDIVSITTSENIVSEGQPFFEYYRSCIYESGSFREMQQDFLTGKANCIKAGPKGDIRYMAYLPLEYNDWMLCYVVPLSTARSSFSFMTTYTLALSGTIALTVIVLIICLWVLSKRSEHALLKRAQTDALTGLLNRASTEALINEWLTTKEFEGIQAFLIMDLDKFKSINDTFGHAVGDEVLRRTADFLKAEFRGSDIVGRLGGDEFIILMKNVRLESVVSYHMQEICERLSRLDIPELEGLELHCSIGAACAPFHGDTFKELYCHADTALYQVKRDGRNHFSIYNKDMDII